MANDSVSDEISILSKASTSPFHTFDAIDGELMNTLIQVLDACEDGDDTELLKLFTSDSQLKERLQNESIDSIEGRRDIPWDDATILWIVCAKIKDDGSPVLLDNGMARDRLGRFPWGDGSPISYLLEYMIEETGSGLDNLLKKLNDDLSYATLSHERYESGFGGLSFMGWLNVDEVEEMNKILLKSSWGVSSMEPHDGGVRQIIKHLTVILKSARAKRTGILLRRHE